MISEKPENKSIIKAILLTVLLLLISSTAIANYVSQKERDLVDKIYPNVYLDKLDIGGKTKKEAIVSYKKINNNLSKLKIKILYDKQIIATFSAATINVQSDAPEIVDRAFLVGRIPRTSSRIYQKLATIFGLVRYDFYTGIKYDKSKIDEFIMHAEDAYNKPARDALFKFENGLVISFRQEEKGLKLKTDKLTRDIDKSIKNLLGKIEDKEIVLESDTINPEITLANSNDFGIEELIGEGKSDFSGSIPNRIHNVKFSASKFNGILVPKDKVFSFNDTVGDISALTGYEQAYIIKNGRTVLGDGGGVCQTSTTLFRAALNTGLPIVERWAHAYRVGYYENDSKPGFDATVYSPTNDLKIKNNTPASILIQTEIVDNILYFRIYGKRDDRRVEISPVAVYDFAPAPEPKYEDDPTLKKGITKQVDFAASGAKASFNYKVISKNPDINFEKKFFSSYRPWQAIFLVGQAD